MDEDKSDRTYKGAPSPGPEPDIKVYKKRWLMLFLFSTINALQAFMSTVLSSSEVSLSEYYGVGVTWLEWTSNVWSATGIIVTIPSAWLVKKYGLRPTLILCATISTIGNIFLLFSNGRRGFLLAFVGTTVSSVGAAFIYDIVFHFYTVMIEQGLKNSFPPRLANVWFDSSQVSTANCIGLLSSTIGNGLGFLVPSFVLVADDGVAGTKKGLEELNWSMMVISIFTLIATVIWYEERPQKAPSKAMSLQLKMDEKLETGSFCESSRQLLRNRGYVLLVASASLVLGVGIAFFTVLDQIVLAYFPDGQQCVGVLGMTSQALGMPALYTAGRILDKTKKFQEVVVLISVLDAVASLAFIVCLYFHSLVGTCLFGIAFGAFNASVVGADIELMVELTHPIAEGTSNGWLVTVGSITAVLLTYLCGQYLDSIGIIGCLGISTGLIALGAILAWSTPKTYRRQKAESDHTSSVNMNKDLRISDPC